MSCRSNKIFDFMMLIGRLKAVKRTGWVLRNVREPESVAAHMYRMAVLSFLTDTQSGLDKDRCMKISLVHDMAESLVGDIAPADGVNKEDKHKQEKDAMEHIRSLVDQQTGQELYNLWQEYEFQSTPEAEFVKDLDKFDMILQAYEYELQDDRPGQLQEFYNSTQGKFKTAQVKTWVEQLYHLRRDFNEKSLQNKDQRTSENSKIDSEGSNIGTSLTDKNELLDK